MRFPGSKPPQMNLTQAQHALAAAAPYWAKREPGKAEIGSIASN
jgi:hypothetical protein